MRPDKTVHALLAVIGLGAVGGVASTYIAPSQSVSEVDADWRPTRDTISKERPTTADELDSQQPDSPHAGPVRLPVPQTPSESGFSYRNCDEARAAGAAPIRRGEPGYGEHMDRDGDGIACEPYIAPGAN